MNGPADRSVRLLLIMAGTLLSYDALRLVAGSRFETVPVDDLAVHVNFDPQERLRLLPGIGPVIARDVMEARNRRPFKGPEDFVARIRGIGPAFVANFGDWLRFDRETDSIAMRRGNDIDQEWLP